MVLYINIVQSINTQHNTFQNIHGEFVNLISFHVGRSRKNQVRSDLIVTGSTLYVEFSALQAWIHL